MLHALLAHAGTAPREIEGADQHVRRACVVEGDIDRERAARHVAGEIAVVVKRAHRPCPMIQRGVGEGGEGTAAQIV